MLSTSTVLTMITASRDDILTYLGSAVPIALVALVALVAAGWGIYLLLKYTRSRGKKI